MELIGKTLKSKATSKPMTIIKVDKKFVYVSTGVGDAKVAIGNIENVFEIDDDTRNAINALIVAQPATKKSSGTPKPKAKHGTENIVFKVTYCDGDETETNYGFRNMCSKKCREQNWASKRTWCTEGNGPCGRLFRKEISEEEFLNCKDKFCCYEKDTLKDWITHAGMDTTKTSNKKRSFRQLNPHGIAVLTTIPNDETERYIFALFKIGSSFEGDEKEEGTITADPKYRVEFTKEESKSLKFWDFYSNKNGDKGDWRSGLFRYLSNYQMLNILNTALELKKGKPEETIVKELIEYIKSVNTK